MEAAAVHFPWRQLGELLVAEELLTQDELEQALAEQATSGRLLGQILVNNGYLSAFSLARVLSEQYGVRLQAREEEAPAEQSQPTLEAVREWRPLVACSASACSSSSSVSSSSATRSSPS